MLILRGAPALSPFRIRKLQANLAALLPGSELPAIEQVYAEFVHLVDVDGTLTDAEHKLLQQLLHYGPALEGSDAQGELFFVIPRFGTISPWASKATDIAHNCGLQKIKRIERGIAFYIQSRESLTSAHRSIVAAALHDRMVEIVLPAFEDAAQIFVQQAPRALTTVDVLQGGRAALVTANSESRSRAGRR